MNIYLNSNFNLVPGVRLSDSTLQALLNSSQLFTLNIVDHQPFGQT
jgi:hypothetical protein